MEEWIAIIFMSSTPTTVDLARQIQIPFSQELHSWREPLNLSTMQQVRWPSMKYSWLQAALHTTHPCLKLQTPSCLVCGWSKYEIFKKSHFHFLLEKEKHSCGKIQIFLHLCYWSHRGISHLDSRLAFDCSDR